MARGKYTLDEMKKQISVSDFGEFSADIQQYVIQSNTLITGKQSLKLNSSKLVRAAIMQVMQEDTEFLPYIVTIQEIADMLEISKSNIYRDIYEICRDINANPIEIKQKKGNTERWIQIPWVKYCEYNSDVGLQIMLNDALKPYLISLKQYYTKYPYESISKMKSTYSIRIFEIINSKIIDMNDITEDGIPVIISLQELKECCNCENKYSEFWNFRHRVIDLALSEINKNTPYEVTYTYIKKGYKVEFLNFHVKKVEKK